MGTDFPAQGVDLGAQRVGENLTNPRASAPVSEDEPQHSAGVEVWQSLTAHPGLSLDRLTRTGMERSLEAPREPGGMWIYPELTVSTPLADGGVPNLEGQVLAQGNLGSRLTCPKALRRAAQWGLGEQGEPGDLPLQRAGNAGFQAESDEVSSSVAKYLSLRGCWGCGCCQAWGSRVWGRQLASLPWAGAGVDGRHLEAPSPDAVAGARRKKGLPEASGSGQASRWRAQPKHMLGTG